MVAATALLAGSAAGQTLDQGLRIDVKRDDAIQSLVHLFQTGLQRVRLGDRARKTVQDETVAAVGSHEALANDTHHDFVRHQAAGIHVLFRLASQRRALLDGSAQDIPGRDLRNGKAFRQHLGLRSLAGTGRSEQYQLHADPP